MRINQEDNRAGSSKTYRDIPGVTAGIIESISGKILAAEYDEAAESVKSMLEKPENGAP